MDSRKETISEIAAESLIEKFKLFFNALNPKKLAKKDFFQNKIISWLIVIGIIANLANWIILAIFIRPVDGSIILHYNVYFGVDIMGNWKQVFIMPSIGLILFLINGFLAAYFYKNKERIAGYILLITSFMAQLSLMVASISVIIINY